MAGLALVTNGRYAIRQVLGTSRLGFPLLRFGPQTDSSYLVNSKSDVCIDGFPRSGNTFAVAAFRRANPGAEIAHHMHCPMQVRRAVRFGVPCVVLARPPVDAVSSVLVYKEGRLSARLAVWSYCAFHRGILELRDSVVVMPFSRLLAEPESVVLELNARYGTDFAGNQIDAESKAAILSEIEAEQRGRDDPSARYSVPVPNLEPLKETAREAVRAQPGIAEATELFDRVLGAAVAGLERR